LAAESVRHFRMVDDELLFAELGEGHLRLGAIHPPDHIAALRFIVLAFDAGLVVVHRASPHAFVGAAARKAAAPRISAWRISWPPSCHISSTPAPSLVKSASSFCVIAGGQIGSRRPAVIRTRVPASVPSTCG